MNKIITFLLVFLVYFGQPVYARDLIGTCMGGVTYPDCSRSGSIGSDCSNSSTGPDPTYLGNYCYNEPECCKHGAGSCCWPERKYCATSSCEGVGQRCGATWVEEWPTGCVGAPDLTSPSPIPPTPVSTVAPIATPTIPFIPSPTIPIVYPTPLVTLQPTAIIPFYPTDEPLPTNENIFNQPTAIPFPTSSFQLPKLPTIDPNILNAAIAKPIIFLKRLFFTIRLLDSHLERKINGEIGKIISQK